MLAGDQSRMSHARDQHVRLRGDCRQVAGPRVAERHGRVALHHHRGHRLADAAAAAHHRHRTPGQRDFVVVQQAQNRRRHARRQLGCARQHRANRGAGNPVHVLRRRNRGDDGRGVHRRRQRQRHDDPLDRLVHREPLDDPNGLGGRRRLVEQLFGHGDPNSPSAPRDLPGIGGPSGMGRAPNEGQGGKLGELRELRAKRRPQRPSRLAARQRPHDRKSARTPSAAVSARASALRKRSQLCASLMRAPSSATEPIFAAMFISQIRTAPRANAAPAAASLRTWGFALVSGSFGQLDHLQRQLAHGGRHPACRQCRPADRLGSLGGRRPWQSIGCQQSGVDLRVGFDERQHLVTNGVRPSHDLPHLGMDGPVALARQREPSAHGHERRAQRYRRRRRAAAAGRGRIGGQRRREFLDRRVRAAFRHAMRGRRPRVRRRRGQGRGRASAAAAPGRRPRRCAARPSPSRWPSRARRARPRFHALAR